MTPASSVSRASESLDIFTRRSQPKVEIELTGQKPRLVNSYTTGDQIEGVATITVEHDTRFDEVDIVLQGTSRAIVERTVCPGRTGSQQMFLKLRQPIDYSDYPTPRLLEPGREYRFPFTFTVPEQLLPQVCRHDTTHDHVHRAHTMLPPTLGDPMLSGNGKTLLDDMAPEMSQVAYVIQVSVLKRSSTDQSQIKPLANIGKKVRIIPRVEEEPPINVAGHAFYCTRKEKSVKRGFLRGKLGRMVMSSAQPGPIQLLPPGCEASDTVSTVATVQLRFDPLGDEQPPLLGSMVSKLRSSTFFSANPWEDFPCQSGNLPFSQVGQGLFTESVPLSTMSVQSAQWKKHSLRSEGSRCDSFHSSSSDDSTGPSEAFSGDTYYTATIVIPVTLPKHKAFVPTFHSCLIARTYALDLSLTWHTPGANVLTPTISLRLPIQITTQSKSGGLIKSSLGVVVTQEELDQFFQPRLVSPPTDVVNVDLAPPEYTEMSVVPVPQTVQST
ncbi:hypothetical protein N7492_006802 [Penicillium capsulatum]|uniref:Bul1 N-terminal domain-containing protein n=1 Tax=Penicillium capsulatum TaxID=69766 RepID=A0A9W9I3M0_9EURO|nr:hypothetical protein N7492_006802 [Penicillium capsulatum]KAJ6116637.1 hypothetical protein N7512_006362 [Penicillium capsulatum]